MSNRQTTIKTIKHAEDFSAEIEISVSYGIGGINYFTGRYEQRGYSLHVQPVQKGDGWRTFTAFTGMKSFLSEANRFSRKTLMSVAENVTDEQIQTLLVAVYNMMPDKGVCYKYAIGDDVDVDSADFYHKWQGTVVGFKHNEGGSVYVQVCDSEDNSVYDLEHFEVEVGG